MIDKKRVKKYCKDYIKIENYDKAIADKNKTWHCHHRKEELGYSQKELKYMEEYFDVPPEDLIFLTHSEHMRLHMKGNQYLKGKQLSAEHKAKISDAMKGKQNAKGNQYWKGKHHSDATRTKISNSIKGKHHSDETKKKISEKNKGKIFLDEAKAKMSAKKKGKAQKKFQWITPSGEIVEMDKLHALRWHKDWKLIA